MINFTDILPPSLAADNKFVAVANALNQSLQFIQQEKNKVLLLYNLDILPNDVLDHLAVQYHCDFYQKNLPIDIKRSMIKESFNWHRHKGTPYAVQTVLNMFMTNAQIQEWFEYGGEPYYFKISFSHMRDIGDGDLTFWKLLYDAKNVRSWLEAIDIILPDEFFPHYHAVCEPVAGYVTTKIDYPYDAQNTLYAATAEAYYGWYNDILNIDTRDESIQHYHAVLEAVAGLDEVIT